MPTRFLTVADVTEVLNISVANVYGLLRTGELKGMQIGQRNQWRIDARELESYIDRMYARTQAKQRTWQESAMAGRSETAPS